MILKGLLFGVARQCNSATRNLDGIVVVFAIVISPSVGNGSEGLDVPWVWVFFCVGTWVLL